tara:strand:+ start:45 stop:296 length:252 start_codon:yes stop_codon:yes gene_type:complete
MNKFLIFIILFFLANCGTPGVALLSPAVTGAKTKSVHQASLSLASSLSSNRIFNKHGIKIKNQLIKNKEKVFDYLNNFHQKKI